MSHGWAAQDLFNYAVAVTPHASTENIRGARYLQNKGTAGLFTVRQNVAAGRPGVAPTAAGTVEVYLAAGQIMPVGASWVGVNAVGLGAGVALVAFY